MLDFQRLRVGDVFYSCHEGDQKPRRCFVKLIDNDAVVYINGKEEQQGCLRDVYEIEFNTGGYGFTEEQALSKFNTWKNELKDALDFETKQ